MNVYLYMHSFIFLHVHTHMQNIQLHFYKFFKNHVIPIVRHGTLEYGTKAKLYVSSLCKNIGNHEIID